MIVLATEQKPVTDTVSLSGVPCLKNMYSAANFDMRALLYWFLSGQTLHILSEFVFLYMVITYSCDRVAFGKHFVSQEKKLPFFCQFFFHEIFQST